MRYREERRVGPTGVGKRVEGEGQGVEEREEGREGQGRTHSVSCCDKPFNPSSSMRFLFSASLAFRSFSYSISSDASSPYQRTLFIPIPFQNQLSKPQAFVELSTSYLLECLLRAKEVRSGLNLGLPNLDSRGRI